jgi:hypothetical protein
VSYPIITIITPLVKVQAFWPRTTKSYNCRQCLMTWPHERGLVGQDLKQSCTTPHEAVDPQLRQHVAVECHLTILRTGAFARPPPTNRRHVRLSWYHGVFTPRWFFHSFSSSNLVLTISQREQTKTLSFRLLLESLSPSIGHQTGFRTLIVD